jgi:hypothetical protein
VSIDFGEPQRNNDNVRTYPKEFYANFGGEELLLYEAAILYLNDPAIVLKWGQTYCPQRGKLVDTAGRHSIWFNGKPHPGIYWPALTEVVDALRPKYYMPPHNLGCYLTKLFPHIGSIEFRMNDNIWQQKYNFGCYGYGKSHIVFNYPIEWHTAMTRLIEVMNEPGDGSEIFVLVHYRDTWCVCRDQGRETVAIFPTGYSGLRFALTAISHLNRNNSHIPTPPRKPPFSEHIKTFAQKVRSGLHRAIQGIAV